MIPLAADVVVVSVVVVVVVVVIIVGIAVDGVVFNPAHAWRYESKAARYVLQAVSH